MKPTKRKAEEAELGASIVEYFAKIPDPRVERTRRHPLVSILVLSLCAVVCGADDFVAIEAFGKAKLDWLRTFLDLPHGMELIHFRGWSWAWRSSSAKRAPDNRSARRCRCRIG